MRECGRVGGYASRDQPGGGSISFFELATRVEIARLPVGPIVPHEVAVSPDGRSALTSEYGRNDHPGRHLIVIDVRGAHISGRIDLGPERVNAVRETLAPSGSNLLPRFQELPGNGNTTIDPRIKFPWRDEGMGFTGMSGRQPFSANE